MFLRKQKFDVSELVELIKNNFSGYQVKYEILNYENSHEVKGNLNVYKDNKDNEPYKQCPADYILKNGSLSNVAFDKQFLLKNHEIDLNVDKIEPYLYNSVENVAAVKIYVDLNKNVLPVVNGKLTE